MENNKKIIDLAQRANVLVRKTLDGNPIVIYDDHRWILNVLFKVFKEKTMPKPNLIYFDAHDDAEKSEGRSKLLNKIGFLTEKANFSVFFLRKLPFCGDGFS